MDTSAASSSSAKSRPAQDLLSAGCGCKALCWSDAVPLLIFSCPPPCQLKFGSQCSLWKSAKLAFVTRTVSAKRAVAIQWWLKCRIEGGGKTQSAKSRPQSLASGPSYPPPHPPPPHNIPLASARLLSTMTTRKVFRPHNASDASHS